MSSKHRQYHTKSQKKRKFSNFLAKYPNSEKLTADNFAKIWEHYDSNNSGYIDEDGLDKFFHDLLETMTNDEVTPQMAKDIKECFMSTYDDAGDGRIAITELANMLPTDENFILLFRREEQLESSVDMMELWRKYDTDHSGYIGEGELKDFIRDLLEKKGSTNVSESKIQEYCNGLITIFDKDKDRRLGLKAMARLLNIKPQDNFLTQFEIKSKNMNFKEKMAHFNKCFEYYDRGNTNAIEGDELVAFVKDLMDPDKDDITEQEVELYKKGILANCDKNGDGKIQKDELKIVLGLYTDVEL
ncbi:Secretagogin [Holothuria leucospilota]|uniref:Secretagogin n=1 Tax=Holothuria leucospilota TaxID=206669 RepID=A0A9Q1CB95_HOLLE|nr:Secretagogin [Holothuria leucospilota]